MAATHGLTVVLADADLSRAEAGLAGIQRFTRSVTKGRMTEEEAHATAARIAPAGDLSAMAAVDLVVEAATENEAVKDTIFKALDEMIPEHAILASNTSSHYPNGRQNQSAGPLHWNAFHESCAGHETRRSDPWTCNQR